jgi:hypothetical protein
MDKKQLAAQIAEYESYCEAIQDEINRLANNPLLTTAVSEACNKAIQAARAKIAALQKQHSEMPKEEKKEEPKEEKKEEPKEEKKEEPKEEKKEEPKEISISASVGRGGKNIKADVELVQSLLNKRINAGLGEDGACGNASKAAIKSLQRRAFGGWSDSKIDPDGKTWKVLIGTGSLPAEPPYPPVPPVPPRPVPSPHNVTNNVTNITNNNVTININNNITVNTNVINNKQTKGKGKIEEITTNVVTNAIDEFIAKYLNYGPKVLFSFNKSVSIPSGVPCVSIEFGASANVEASIVSERVKEAAKITSKATLRAQASASCAIVVSIGLYIPLYGQLEIGNIKAGLRLRATLTGTASASLEAANGALTGSLHDISATLNASAEFFISSTLAGWETFCFLASHGGKSYVHSWIPGSKINGAEVRYVLGSCDVLTLSAPSFSLSFNLKQGRFDCGSTGSISASIHPTLKAKMNAMFKSFT